MERFERELLDNYGKEEEKKEYPPKVIAMYEAVLELFASGRNLDTMKVSEITRRAGIGKGTAYEYFSTKEEIIVGALSYEAERYMGILFDLLRHGKDFTEVIQKGLDLIEEANERYHGFAILEKILQDSGLSGKNMLDEMEKHKDSIARMVTLTKQFVELALRDGAITETDTYKVQITILSQFVAYAFYLTHHCLYPDVEREKARSFAYESILKMLNGRIPGGQEIDP